MVSLLPVKDVTSLSVHCTLSTLFQGPLTSSLEKEDPGNEVVHIVSKTASLVLREREDPENEDVTTTRNLKCKLLKINIGAARR